MSKLVCVGQIVNVHGIKGAVKIKPYLNNSLDIDSFGPLTDQQEKRLFHIQAQSQKQGIVLAFIQDVTDRTTAESLKGTYLYLPREKLPQATESEFYYFDLVGLRVMKSEQVFGTVDSVENFGAGDIINVKLSNGKIFPFDFSNATFPVVDVESGFMEINLPEGMEEVIHEN